MKIPSPGDRRKSAERRRREAVAYADSNEWVNCSQAWETIVAKSGRLMATQADRRWDDPGARPLAATT